MTNPQLTDITFLLDRSGSMTKIADDTIGGFNHFLKDQRELAKSAGRAVVSLVQFDNQYEPVYSGVDVDHAPELTAKTFQPRGSTALYDAAARVIQSTGARLAALPEHERPGKVIIVIMTDGDENTSVEFQGMAGAALVKKMIAKQEQEFAWTFLFLGANIDAAITAGRLGIAAGNAVQYAATGKGAESAIAATSRGISNLRGMSMSPDARQKAQKDFKTGYMSPEDLAVVDAHLHSKDAKEGQ